MATILTGLIGTGVFCLFAASLWRSGRSEPPAAPLDPRLALRERKVETIKKAERVRMLRASLESERDKGRISEEERRQLSESLAIRERIEALVASRRARFSARVGGSGTGPAMGPVRAP